jgi:hypothetical protein
MSLFGSFAPFPAHLAFFRFTPDSDWKTKGVGGRLSADFAAEVVDFSCEAGGRVIMQRL